MKINGKEYIKISGCMSTSIARSALGLKHSNRPLKAEEEPHFKGKKVVGGRHPRVGDMDNLAEEIFTLIRNPIDAYKSVKKMIMPGCVSRGN